MEFPKKQLLVVGDRVLITPEDGDERTRVGLYLPATAIDAQQVQTGLIVATGRDPRGDLSSLDDEPWKMDARENRSRGMQENGGPRHLLSESRGRDHLRRKEVPGRAPGGHSGPGTG